MRGSASCPPCFRLSKQTAYYLFMMCYGLCAWSIAAHAVVVEVLTDGVGESTVFTSSWVIGWANVLITQVRQVQVPGPSMPAATV